MATPGVPSVPPGVFRCLRRSSCRLRLRSAVAAPWVMVPCCSHNNNLEVGDVGAVPRTACIRVSLRTLGRMAPTHFAYAALVNAEGDVFPLLLLERDNL